MPLVSRNAASISHFSDYRLIRPRYNEMTSRFDNTEKIEAGRDSVYRIASPPDTREAGADLDEAYTFLADHTNTTGDVNLARLRRKIDWRIVPLLFLVYLLNLLDKVSLNVRTR